MRTSLGTVSEIYSLAFMVENDRLMLGSLYMNIIVVLHLTTFMDSFVCTCIILSTSCHLL